MPFTVAVPLQKSKKSQQLRNLEQRRERDFEAIDVSTGVGRLGSSILLDSQLIGKACETVPWTLENEVISLNLVHKLLYMLEDNSR